MKKIICLVLALAMTAVMFVGCAPKSTVVINTAEDLNGKKIGVQGGTTGESWVQDNVEGADKNLSSYKSGMDAALELKNGTIDAIVLDELPAKAIVEKNPDLKILDIALTTEEYAIAVKKGNTELVDAINATIKRMKDDGTYQALNDAFIPADGNIVIPESKVTEGDVIKMGTNAAFPPFEYIDGDKIVGFDISMSEEVALDLGKKLEVVDMNFDSLLNALQAGQIDFVAAGMSVKPDRLEYADFSDPYFSSTQVIIVKK